MRQIRKLCGLFALLIALGIAGLAVFGGFSMAGLATGLVLFCGLGGMWLITS